MYNDEISRNDFEETLWRRGKAERTMIGAGW